MIYALDTNIVSYDLKNTCGIREKLEFLNKTQNKIIIPPITFYEVLRGLKATSANKKLERFNLVFLPYLQDTMSAQDWLVASGIYADCKKRGHPMAENDLLQAAFCVRQRLHACHP